MQLITQIISGVIKARTVHYKNHCISKFYKSEEQCGVPSTTRYLVLIQSTGDIHVQKGSGKYRRKPFRNVEFKPFYWRFRLSLRAATLQTQILQFFSRKIFFTIVYICVCIKNMKKKLIKILYASKKYEKSK